MARRNKDWTRDEHIIAFNLYCQIPFGQIHKRLHEGPKLRLVRRDYQLAALRRDRQRIRGQGIDRLRRWFPTFLVKWGSF